MLFVATWIGLPCTIVQYIFVRDIMFSISHNGQLFATRIELNCTQSGSPEGSTGGKGDIRLDDSGFGFRECIRGA